MKIIKKLFKWYFRKAADSYAWMPTGCTYIRDIETLKK